jgi:hypothetical protein
MKPRSERAGTEDKVNYFTLSENVLGGIEFVHQQLAFLPVRQPFLSTLPYRLYDRLWNAKIMPLMVFLKSPEGPMQIAFRLDQGMGNADGGSLVHDWNEIIKFLSKPEHFFDLTESVKFFSDEKARAGLPLENFDLVAFCSSLAYVHAEIGKGNAVLVGALARSFGNLLALVQQREKDRVRSKEEWEGESALDGHIDSLRKFLADYALYLQIIARAHDVADQLAIRLVTVILERPRFIARKLQDRHNSSGPPSSG